MVLEVGLLSKKAPQGRLGSCQETYSKEANWGLGTSEGMVLGAVGDTNPEHVSAQPTMPQVDARAVSSLGPGLETAAAPATEPKATASLANDAAMGDGMPATCDTQGTTMTTPCDAMTPVSQQAMGMPATPDVVIASQ
jgi:hypothetical protein